MSSLVHLLLRNGCALLRHFNWSAALFPCHPELLSNNIKGGTSIAHLASGSLPCLLPGTQSLALCSCCEALPSLGARSSAGTLAHSRDPPTVCLWSWSLNYLRAPAMLSPLCLSVHDIHNSSNDLLLPQEPIPLTPPPLPKPNALQSFISFKAQTSELIPRSLSSSKWAWALGRS